MLSTTNVSYRIGDQQILEDISAQFKPGEFTMILGPNGSGKSSFLKIFSGDIKQHGAVKYSDIPVNDLSKLDLARIRAVMSQQPELSFPLTVSEVVMMGRYPHFENNPGTKDHDICKAASAKLNITAMLDRNYLTLSGGEKQRVQFARVLAQIWETPLNGCRYLFLDEPLTNLDIRYQQEFLSICRSLLDPHTVIVAVMHDINLAVQYADSLLFLKGGKKIAHGKPGEILSSQLLKEVFEIDAHIMSNPIDGTPMMIPASQHIS